MLINELKLRNLQISTGNVNTAKAGNAEEAAQQSGNICRSSAKRA